MFISSLIEILVEMALETRSTFASPLSFSFVIWAKLGLGA
jgi:hypothetical protein